MANFALTSKAKIMILFANQYDMKDDSGNKVTGCSVHYLFWGENGEVLSGSHVPEQDRSCSRPL